MRLLMRTLPVLGWVVLVIILSKVLCPHHDANDADGLPEPRKR